MTHQTTAIDVALAETIAEAVRARFGCALPGPVERTLELPAEPAFGDVACTIAMKLAKTVRQRPLDIAQALAEELQAMLPSSSLQQQIERLDVKPPGFINMFLSHQALCAIVEQILDAGARFGTSTSGQGQQVSLEFVSANPTGPLSIAHGRQAAVGDALGRVLRATGCRVDCDYFINDEGTQMELLGQSLRARYLEQLHRPTAIPEGGYQGAYVVDIARQLLERHGHRWQEQPCDSFRDYAIERMLAVIKEDLAAFDVSFDRWTSQRALREAGRIDRAMTVLQHAGHTYEAEGALWFRATGFGDDKDRVLRKRDGAWTYFAPDVAYHQYKFSAGAHRAINLWGPDHHGYVSRLQAAVHALTGHGDDLAVLIVQLVTLYRRGQPVPMSTRQGQFITLRELIQEVGKDAARFLFLTRRLNSHLDFDLEVARSQSLENPVYYVQYAHARSCGILALREQRAAVYQHAAMRPERLTQPEELLLLRRLRQFPLAVKICAQQLDPYGITAYLRDLASGFHACYARHRVVGDDVELSVTRLALIAAVRQVLANGLQLVGVSAPEAMERIAGDS